MADQVTLAVNGNLMTVPYGTTVAVAMAMLGQPCRNSVSGNQRGPLCGMGICFECRVEIDRKPHCKSCQIVCEPGMKVRTNG